MLSDEQWMQRALELATIAEDTGEVPIGAVLVKEGTCLGEGWNSPISSHDPTAHAEIIALRRAGALLHNYRLVDTTLYVTLEPCVMCMGAIIHARVTRLVFGADDPKRGAVCSAVQLADSEFSNHKVQWQGGVLSEQCSAIINKFFSGKRRLK